MDQQQKQTGGGNGFILGVIVGVLIALLFTTKKGRAILRDLSEKVIAKLSSMEQYAKQTDDVSELFDELDDEEDYIKPEPQPVAPVQKKEAEPVVKEVERKAEKPEVKKETPKPAPQSEPVEESVAERIEALDEPVEKAPAKAIQGRRWFRGLRKKG